MSNLNDFKNFLSLTLFEELYYCYKSFSSETEKSIFLSLLKNSNEAQIKAILKNDGQSLIHGEAGCGKTEMLLKKAVFCFLKEKKTDNTAFLTFSSKAAREAKLRLYNLILTLTLTPEAKNFFSPLLSKFSALLCGTFHSVCYKILNDKVFNLKNCETIGFKSRFFVISEQESLDIIKKTAPGEDADFLYKCFLNFTNSLRTPDFIKKSDTAPYIKNIYSDFMLEKINAGVMDFNDLIYYTAMLLRKNPAVKEHYNSKINFMFLDDYQDADFGHYVVFRLITGKNTNITACGDDKQKIFYFKNSEINSFELFKQDFKNAEIFKFSDNFRCPKKTLKIMSKIFDFKNTEKNGRDSNIFFKKSKDEQEEAAFIASKIKESDTPLNEICVGIRNSFQALSIEGELKKLNIPVFNTAKHFNNSPEFSAFLSFLNLIFEIIYASDFYKIKLKQNKANKLCLDIISTGAFSFEPEDMLVIKSSSHLAFSFFNDEDYKKIITNLTKKGQKSFERFIYGVLDITNFFYSLPAEEIGLKMIDFLGLNSDDAKREKVSKTIKLHIRHYSSIYKGLDNLTLFEKYVFDMNTSSINFLFKDDTEAVKIATLHSLKGLEFKMIFIPGFEKGMFPALKFFKFPHKKHKLNFIEFEKKLFYTAVSRAKETVFFSAVKKRNTPLGLLTVSTSPFFKYIKKDVIVL